MLEPQTRVRNGLPAEAVERQVHAIAGSLAFSNAEVLRALLLFLARRTLFPEASGNPPKEHEIATEVLGRTDAFDSRIDSSVRVLVGRLRSKLAEYYVGPGSGDAILIEIPKGSYSLVAKPRITVLPQPAPQAEKPRPRRANLKLAIGCGAGVAVGLAVGLLVQWGRGPASSEEQQRFWKPFLDSSRPLLLVLGTPTFATIGPSWVVRSPSFLAGWPRNRENPELEKLERLLDSPARAVYTYVASGEALAALTLTQELEALRPKMRFRRSAQFQWDELRSHDAIFLGAPKLNPPTEDLPIPEELICDQGEIRNLRPKPGERASYGITRISPEGPVAEGHVLVTRYSRAGMLGELIVVGSPVSEGTWAAADYLSKPAYLRTLLERMARADGQIPPRFQLVLRYRMKSDIPIEISYITHHELGPDTDK